MSPADGHPRYESYQIVMSTVATIGSQKMNERVTVLPVAAPRAQPAGDGRAAHRLLGLELQALARALLPEEPRATALAAALRALLRHRRDQHDVLPAAEARDRGALGGRVAAGLPLRR